MRDITSNEFRDFIASGTSVIQFSADWCGPCKVLTPNMMTASNSEEMADVSFAKVNIDNCQSLASEFSIRSVPTVVIFQDGLELKRTMGVKTTTLIKQFIRETVDR
tara:strand:- start:1087 stop:1404 length:318 start_codon:yes stop_codon:yes gene_type:complete